VIAISSILIPSGTGIIFGKKNSVGLMHCDLDQDKQGACGRIELLPKHA
jgi:hypothetical protein